MSQFASRALFAIAMLACVCVSSPAFAQQNNGNFGGFFGFGEIGTVGGILVNPSGTVEAAPGKLAATDLKRLADLVGQANQNELQSTVTLRKVSLRGLYDAVVEATKANKPLPAEVAFMAGLQRIEYVYLVPDQKDIILAGPAEGWKIDEAGNVVGKTTGCPVLRLEDFVVALRTVDSARQDAGISCSIDPTAEGTAALNKLFKQIRDNGGFRPEAANLIEETCGPQVIRLTGMPTSSRYAQVLVAADYKLKRLSMGFEQAPIENLPSYLQLAQASNSSRNHSAPRFWMECSYLPLGRSEDGLTWQLRGTGVKTLVEDGRLDDEGKRVATNSTNKIANKWAETMTENFDALAQKEPAFRELRNLMDMSVVAALIAKENMLERADLDLALWHDNEKLPVSEFNTPKTVPTQCSFVRLTSSWLVTASGGVQVDSWSVVAQSEVLTELNNVTRVAFQSPNKQWWWN